MGIGKLAMLRYEKAMNDILKKYSVRRQWHLSFVAYLRSFKNWDTWVSLSTLIVWAIASDFLWTSIGFTGLLRKGIYLIGFSLGVIPFYWILTRNAYKHLLTITFTRNDAPP